MTPTNDWDAPVFWSETSGEPLPYRTPYTEEEKAIIALRREYRANYATDECPELVDLTQLSPLLRYKVKEVRPVVGGCAVWNDAAETAKAHAAADTQRHTRMRSRIANIRLIHRSSYGILFR